MASTNDRRSLILNIIDADNVCTYDTLAKHTGVSTMTIRRDAEELEKRGKVIKTLRGIRKTPQTHPLEESNVHGRIHVNRQEKQAIAAAALDLIHPGQTLYIDGGTTCLEFARALVREQVSVTTVTNSLLICAEMGRYIGNTVICLGGEYNLRSECFVGTACEEMANRYFVDLAIMSTKAFLPETGTMESSTPVFRIKQAVVRRAAKTALLVDHTKFNQRALYNVLTITQIDSIVVDDGIDQKSLSKLKDQGKDVITASVSADLYRYSGV